MLMDVVGDGRNPQKTVGELEEVARLSFEADLEIHREMRTAVRFYAGQQDPGGTLPIRAGGPGYENRLPQAPGAKRRASRLRYVQNHIPRLSDIFCNRILAEVPDIEVVPVTGGDVRAAPLAAMNKEIYEHHKRKTASSYRQKIAQDALNFVVCGEIATKLYWDDLRDCVHEENIAPFDLGRAPGSHSIEDSPWHVFRRIYTAKEFERMYGTKMAERLSIQGGGEHPYENMPYAVFSTSETEYSKVNGVQVSEYYERPTNRYREGRYFFFSGGIILEQGTLPGGVYPIVAQRFLMTPNLPRGHSFIRNVYRIQMEINRALGQDATNMSHFGDDKFVTNAQSHISTGSHINGATHLRVSAYGGIKDAFMYVEGKGMPKYSEYVERQIRAMDYICHTVAQMEDRKQPTKGGDLSVVLYSQVKDRENFVPYAQAFEDYMVSKGRRILDLYRHYLMPDEIIHTGNREKTILAGDFKRTSDTDYLFAVVAGNESDESRLGKQIQIDKIMQFRGKEIDDVGMGFLLKNSVLGNDKRLIRHYTAKEEAWENNQMELEKGSMPEVSEVEDFSYKAKMCTTRMSEPDFKYLPDLVKELYRQFMEICKEGIQKAENDRLRLEQGVIPTDGALIKTDIQRSTPKVGGGVKTEPVKLPFASLSWLIQALEKQGATQDALAGLPAGEQRDIMEGVQSAPEQLGAPPTGETPPPMPGSPVAGAQAAPPPRQGG